MDLRACLPFVFRNATITPITAGLSGAGVYRVDGAGQTLVLKVSSDAEPLARWRSTLDLRQRAAEAGVAPRIVHVDEQHRAIASEFVPDRSFFPLYMQSRDAALELLGETLRKVHDIPLPADLEPATPLALLAETWTKLAPVAPPFVAAAVERVLAEPPPARDRPLVVSHNDVNPTNLTYNRQRLWLLDWDTAGANDPLYDLATVAVFLRMNDDDVAKLVAAHDRVAFTVPPAAFVYYRRLVAVLCGAMFLQLAHVLGHSPTDSPPLGLADVYQRMRDGTLSVATAEGRWAFGLALVNSSYG